MKVKLMHQVKPLADEQTGPIAQFMSNGFVFVAELMNCSVEDFKEDKEYEVDVKFYCHEICGIYKTSEEFQKENPDMAEQSYIPIGAFPASQEDKNWRPSPMNYINSVVDEVVDNAIIDAPENLVLFYGKINDEDKIDQVLYYRNHEDKDEVKSGYIISGVYWAELFSMEKGENDLLC